MKKILRSIWYSEPLPLARAELIIASFTLFILVFSLPEDIRSEYLGDVSLWDVIGSREFLRTLVLFAVTYFGFLALNFYAVPTFFRKETIWKGLLIGGVVFASVGLSFGRFNICVPLLIIFACYSILRYTAIYLWENSENIHKRFRFISPTVLAASAVCVLGIIPAILTGEAGIVVGWITAVPTTIFLYTYSTHSLIPRTNGRRRPFLAFMLRYVVLTAIFSLAITFMVVLIADEEDAAPVLGLLTFFFNVFFAAPITWLLFKRTVTGKELTFLKKELGQSSASLDFLRSQINPHFLFNALNTLYGTAIVEKADKTSEGIQRLGDMMRFMLHENMQETIPLTREVEYLSNYIALQRLRTDGQPSVRVETAIEQDVYFGSVPPMLLIPFVENAFKHGISFREPSHIRITLDATEKILNFDVYNSKHMRQGTDPEKDNNGIGLVNVKQRLELLYPKRHELTIRETATEFFVHLTLQLSLPK